MRNIGWFTWGSVIACVLSLSLFGWAFQQRGRDVAEVERLAAQTQHALCTFKGDLRARYVNGLEFYERNPNGIPGISGAEIARSLANQKATLDSLSSLECP